MKLAGVLAVFLGVSVISQTNLSAHSSKATIAFGNRHAVALRTNGEALTWGENSRSISPPSL